MIRRATPDDAAAISDVFVRARDEMTYLPRIPEHVRPQLGGWFLERAELWVFEEQGRVLGFAGVSGGELTHLYTDPPAQRRGVGRTLLDHVKSLQLDRLQLWCSRRTRALAGSMNDTVSSWSGSPTARGTWNKSRTPSTSGIRLAQTGAKCLRAPARQLVHQRLDLYGRRSVTSVLTETSSSGITWLYVFSVIEARSMADALRDRLHRHAGLMPEGGTAVA
jgi:GNAT superfamily N-acetyltransferase